MPQTKTGSLTLSRVTDGTPGNASITHMAYQNAASGTAPTLPTTSSIDSDGLLENADLNNSWTAVQATPTSSQVTWVTSRIFLQTAGTGAFAGQGSSWTTAAQVSGSGGNSTFTASIFIRTNTPPTVAPSGTSSSYNFSTNVLSGVPTGFFAAIPTGTNPLYISSGTFSAAGTGTDTGVTWTVPALFAVQGTAGTRGPGRFDRSITLDQVSTLTLVTAGATSDVFTATLGGTVITYTLIAADSTLTLQAAKLANEINTDTTFNGSASSSGGVITITRAVQFTTLFTSTGSTTGTYATTTASVPEVGDTDYNIDALTTMCEALGGSLGGTGREATICYTSSDVSDSIALTGGAPVAGDIVILTYLSAISGVDPSTEGAIHDGTAQADDDWTAFAVQIDGNLLVQGTVVADELTIGNNGEFFVDVNGNLTLRSLTVTSPPTSLIRRYNYNAAVNSTVAGDNDYICTRRDGCIITDLSVMPPAVNGWAVMGTARLAGVPSSYVGLDSEGQPQTFDSNGTTFTPATPTGDAVQINNDAIRIFDGGILRVVLGNLD